MINVIHNVLSPKELDFLQNILISGKGGEKRIPLFFNSCVIEDSGMQKTPLDEYPNPKESHSQCVHVFLHNGRYSGYEQQNKLLGPLLRKLPIRLITRAKYNLTHGSERHRLAGWHYDFDRKPHEIERMSGEKDLMNGCFYVNTNNGFTLLEDGTKIPSIANSFSCFPNTTLHTAVTQTDTEIRGVINFNFYT